MNKTEMNSVNPEALDLEALMELVDEMQSYIKELHVNQGKLEGDNLSLRNQARKLYDDRFDYMQKFAVHY